MSSGDKDEEDGGGEGEGEGEGEAITRSLWVRIGNELLNLFQMASVIANPIIYGIFHKKPDRNPLR